MNYSEMLVKTLNETSTTEAESTVFLALAKECYYEASCTVGEIAKLVDSSNASVKGVLGSLTKKGLVTSIEGKREKNNQWFKTQEFMPVVCDEIMSFACDQYDYDGNE